MISVFKALQIVELAELKPKTQKLELSDSFNKILAQDITSPINMPPFRQSAMDGYAFKLSDSKSYKLVAESKAGDNNKIRLKAGQAARIFTGALVPDEADTVVIQEHVNRSNNTIIINKLPKRTANVRPIGEQVQKGEIVLKKGQQLNAAAIGFLAGIGIPEVLVHKTPRVAIIVTGNELQQAGKDLEAGKIYESNSIMLSSALKTTGITNILTLRTKDTFDATKSVISEALENSDVVLVSGGISVGDYDFVQEALKDNGVNELFYKVNQKPGKPLWFGRKNDQFVFGLPGNPASALSCFYIYVTPLLNKMNGAKDIHLKRIKAKSLTDYKNTTGKTLFLKGMLNENMVEILYGQQSSMLHSFAKSNVLVRIPNEMELLNKNDDVECISLNI
ncbi:MAG: molybdopterin molybdotransferase MoeA [Flavobacteriaceae bacterium]|nr:molybdopterin molybdotransferase MoeA [Bacteroidia bacterium]NNL15331.1 molybdopterin molybdotransferase MoeA [Flavobacteriaceae bacterium]